MLEAIYTLLTARLQSINALKEVGWYMGQPTRDNAAKLYTTPAAYLEVRPFNTLTEYRKLQRAAVDFVIYTTGTSLHTGSKRLAKATATDHMALVEAVHAALQGWRAYLSNHPQHSAVAGTADDYLVINSIQRVQLQPDHTWGAIIATPQVYRAMVRWAGHATTTQPANPDIDISTDA